MKALTLCILLAFALPCVAQAARNPNHDPPENIWWADPATYSAIIGAGATYDFAAAIVTIGVAAFEGVCTFTLPIETLANLGTKGTEVATVKEYGDGYHHTTVLTGISMLDAVTSTGTELVGGIAYTFPEGAIVVHSVLFDGKVFAASLTDTATAFGVGTAVGSGALTTTEQNLLITGALDGAITTTPGVTHRATSLSSLNGAGVTPAYFDGTASAIVAYINMTDTSWGASEDVTITGSLTIVWDFIGDF